MRAALTGEIATVNDMHFQEVNRSYHSAQNTPLRHTANLIRCWARSTFHALLRHYMANTLPAPPSTSPAIPRWPVIRNPVAAYAASLLLSCLALALRFYLDPIMGNSSRLGFFIMAA